jgi:signal transduction histidine kinase
MMYRISMDVSPSPITWARLSAFIRQLGHDIRNDLNALSLEAALLKELVADPEAVTSATRIQTQLRDIANRLKELSTRYAIPAPQPAPISLAELASHLQGASGPEAIEWEGPTGEAQVHTDPALVARAFRELVQNAARHSALHQKPKAMLAAAPLGGGVLILREVGGEEFAWPAEPFETPRAGRYGAGLSIATGIFRGLGIGVERKKIGDAMETRLTFPAA